MNIKKLATGVGILIALVLGFIGATKSPSQVVVQQPSLGSLTGPDIPYQYLNIGGVRHEYRSSALNTATTTPCAQQSPAATSTLVRASLRIDTATSTATVWAVATSTTAFATTTPLTSGTFSLASGKTGSMLYQGTSTPITDGIGILPPSSYIVWSVQGTVVAGTAKLNGECKAEFLVL